MVEWLVVLKAVDLVSSMDDLKVALKAGWMANCSVESLVGLKVAVKAYLLACWMVG